MKRKVEFIVFNSGSHASKLMFADVDKIENAIQMDSVFEIKNPFLKMCNKVHMSGKINRKIKLPFRSIWDKYYITEIAKRHLDIEYIFVYTNVSIKKVCIEYLQELEKLSNVHLVLIAVDSFVDKFLCPLDVMQKVKFDLVYSFDPNDSEKHNLIFTRSLYSKREDIVPAEKSVDLFFVGRAKDRLDYLLSIVKRANDAGLSCGFYILGVKENKRIPLPGVIYIDEVMSYDDVLPIIMSSKCLVDIVQKGQEGLTMRTYEAIFYNKYLLTNNPGVRSLNYFADDYMKYVETLDQIDFDFLKNDQIDYHYDYDYSPIRLLSDIEDRLGFTQ